ncbi:MAG: penicillin-binding transpeptidase domain-containing protein [Oscillospiraceae bacterium]|nr:penicillin-binding transpeptidase domain-containing protein [Oscillospiraceae bacterium]
MENINTKRARRKIDKRIWVIAVLFSFVVFIFPVAQLYHIQIVQHDHFTQLAQNQQTSNTVIHPNRGRILDRNGVVLAQSISVETVVINPSQIRATQTRTVDETRALVAQGLSEILDNVSEQWIYARAERSFSGNEYIARRVDREVAGSVREFTRENRLGDIIHLIPDTKRVYPLNDVASHIVGFTGFENTGLHGVEMRFDSFLSGVPGQIVNVQDASGNVVPFQFERYIDASDGNDVVLTIDSSIQYFLENALREAVEVNHVQQRAQGIVYNVQTGEILAMATMGNFDLNEPFALTDSAALTQLETLEGEERDAFLYQQRNEMWRLKSVNDIYEPGSVFKVITAAIGLEVGAVRPEDMFNCTGSLKVQGWDYPIGCVRRHGHGSLNFIEGMHMSCNPVFMQVGQRIGGEVFYEYLEAFGLLSRTGIDLPGEANSYVMSRERMRTPLDVSMTSFGQSNLFTPLQVMTSVGAVANGGRLMRPFVVREVRDSEGQLIESFEPYMVRQVISEETSRIVNEMLEGAVTDGTGRNGAVAGFRVAGKTGTSEKINPETGARWDASYGKYIVSFLSYAPADNPKIAVLITLDEPMPPGQPNNFRTGGRMAAPAARRVLEQALPHLGVERQYADADREMMNVNIPNVMNLSAEEARRTLQGRHLSARTEGDGSMVTGQRPAAGATVLSGTEVILYMGVPVPDAMVDVPDVIGMSQSDARAALENVGLFIRFAGTVGASSGRVIAEQQSNPAGEQVPKGRVIEVTFFDDIMY